MELGLNTRKVKFLGCCLVTVLGSKSTAPQGTAPLGETQHLGLLKGPLRLIL